MSIARLVSALPKRGHVFVSYARADMARVQELVRTLEARGIRCELDEKVVSGGELFPAQLAEAIRKSSGVVVMLSPVSVNRPWVYREVAFAQEQKIPVFPVELAPVEIPDTLALRVQDLHRIRLHEAAPPLAARHRPGTKLVRAAALVLGLGVGAFVRSEGQAVWPAWSKTAAREALPAIGSSDEASGAGAVGVDRQVSGRLAAPPPLATRTEEPPPSEPTPTPQPAEVEGPAEPSVFQHPGSTKIVVVDFDVSGAHAEPGDGARFAEDLVRALEARIQEDLPAEGVLIQPEQLEVRRLDRPVRSHTEARELGQSIGADVVLWGTGDCQLPKYGSVILRGEGGGTAVKGRANIRCMDQVTVEGESRGTGTGALDVEGCPRRPTYAICTYAAMVGWTIQGRSDHRFMNTREEFSRVLFGELAMGKPGLVMDLLLGLHFAKRYDPKTAHRFLTPARETLKRRPDLIELGLWVARVDDNLGYKREALASLEVILESCRERRNVELEAATLNEIGSVYSDLGEKQKALSYYEQALLLIGKVGDVSGEAATLNNIGSVYSALGEKQKALSYVERALPLFQKVGNRSGAATTLNNIGFVYDGLGEKQKALGYYEQASPLLRKVGNLSGEASTLNNIGRVYDDLGKKRKALSYFGQALPLSRRVGDVSGEAATLNNIGRVYSDLGEKQKALSYFERALPLSRKVGNLSGEATTLNNIGFVYDGLGEKQKALGYCQLALPLFQKVGNRSGEATTLNNIGRVYSHVGEKQRALSYVERALPLFQKVGDVSGEAATLNNIGRAYSDLGEKQKALSYVERALPLFQKVGNLSGEAATLNNIGRVYSDHGEKQKALSYFERALPLFQKVGDVSGEAATLHNIASVYDDLGEKQKALSYYERALPLRQKVGDVSGEAATLNNIGSVYGALGEKRMALSYYERALPLLRTVGDVGGLYVTLFNRSMVLFDLRRVDPAFESLGEAVRLGCGARRPDCASHALSWYRKAMEHERPGQARQALAVLRDQVGESDAAKALLDALLLREGHDQLTGGELVVTLVQEGSNAFRSGLRVGDVLATYRGVRLTPEVNFPELVRSTQGEARVEIELLRDGALKTVSVAGGRLGVGFEQVP